MEKYYDVVIKLRLNETSISILKQLKLKNIHYIILKNNWENENSAYGINSNKPLNLIRLSYRYVQVLFRFGLLTLKPTAKQKKLENGYRYILEISSLGQKAIMP